MEKGHCIQSSLEKGYYILKQFGIYKKVMKKKRGFIYVQTKDIVVD